MAKIVVKLDPRGHYLIPFRRPDLQYIGLVYRGMEFGALAMTPDGRYVQVNGDVTVPLNSFRVDAALQVAGGQQARNRQRPPRPPHLRWPRDPSDDEPAAHPAPEREVTSTPVIVRPRRRLIVRPEPSLA